jgi:RimJ/RimL family protein N-acetyltransferase
VEKKVMLEGSSVELLPMETDQVEGLWRAAEPQQIWEFTSSKIRSKEEMKLTVEAAIKERELDNQIPFVVAKKGSGKIIGSSRFLDVSEKNKSLEIGWTWYHPDYWRSAVNTETKFLLLQYAFEEMKMNRVQFCTDSRNIRSQNAIQRIGAKKEGILRKHRIIADGYVRDTVVFSIIQEDWPGVKSLLLGKMNRS